MHVYIFKYCALFPLLFTYLHLTWLVQNARYQCIITHQTLFLVPETTQQRDEDDLPSEEDDGLPDTLSGDELTDKRYTGGQNEKFMSFKIKLFLV